MAPESGRVALVTGAARGIGAATVDLLVERGYRVMALDAGGGVRPAGVEYDLASEDQLHALVDRHGDHVIVRALDVRDAASLTDAAAEAVAEFGRIDAAVAAAAVMVGGLPLWETPAEHLRTLLEIDVVGVWNTAAAVVPHMLAGPDPSGCRFVAIASAAGEQGLFRLAGYNVAKHAVIGIVRGLAADLVGTGVTAVAVSPGSTTGAMLQATAAIYGVDAQTLAESQLLRRPLEPVEVAATIAHCCSIDGAALNGSVVNATGGFSS